MKNQTILITLGILVIAGAGGYVLSETEFYKTMMSSQRAAMNTTPETSEVKETISSDLHGMQNMEVLSEQEFISHMIPHHQEAVDASMEVLARGENAEVRALAEAIIIAQEKEIANMKTWHQTWFKTAVVADTSYEPMMRDLGLLQGNELDRAFLEDMIPHHMDALMMAQQVAPKIEHPEIAALTAAIAETQSNEVINMRILLKQI